MNKLCCLIITFSTCGVCEAQNLVSNGDFEQYVGCPNNVGQIDSCLFWFKPTWGTTDYFNQCSNPSPAGVPVHNLSGYQFANSGGAYAAIILYEIDLGSGTYREYLEVQLTSALIANDCYHFEMFVNLTNNCLYATDTFSIYFSDSSINGITNWDVLPFIPQIKISNGINSDTLNWNLMESNYNAVGGEQYVIIGNFNSDTNTNLLLLNPSGTFEPGAYYYIDDVALTPCTSIEEQTENNAIKIFPNPFSNKINMATKRNEFVEVTLFDVTARKIFKQSFTNSTSINTEQLAKGIYLYEVRNKNGVIKKGKVVKD